VKETLKWLVHESNVWTEITNLIIPRENDSRDELKAMCDWILDALGDSVPVHFTAFHPDFRLTDRERTPAETLLAAHEIAVQCGLKYAYVGNIQAQQQQTTYCPSCRRTLIERVGYSITKYELNGNACRHCDATIAGHYDAAPGDWGSRRQPVRISEYDVRPSREFGISPGPPAANAPTSSKLKNNTMPVTAAPPAPPLISALSAEQEQSIVRGAARILAAATQGRNVELTPAELNGAGEIVVLGAFVSLKRSGKLRGCCGFLGQSVPLGQALVHAACRTVSDDHRFPPVASRELPHLDVEVWLLSNQQTVTARGNERIGAIQIGKHGLQIAHGNSRGLLLPGVAVDMGLNAEQFLEHVCLKAELHTAAWRADDATLWTFEGHAIRAPLSEFISLPRERGAALPVTAQELPALAEYCRANLAAFLSGATPNYFAFGLPDGNVNGLIVSLIDPEGREFLQANRMSFKESLPLQSTLFSMTEGLAQTLARMRVSPEQARQARVALTIAAHPSLHGTVDEPDLRGVDPGRHLVVVIQRNHAVAMFDPQQTAESLVNAAAAAAQISHAGAAQVFALECLTSLSEVKMVNVPSPAPGAQIRPAAVAGRFYPADSAELSKLVDRCLPAQSIEPQSWPAVMVPHAGLIYSGHIAGQTLARVRIPSTVIVIGPKHTRHGVEWAASPHTAWSIPGATLASDPELARKLCEAIPGLQLDAAAHAQEHGIEVELPLLARLAPQAKIVGIAIGGGDLFRARQFADGLSKVIASMTEPPLLVISSDMNHYASDAENRRLDELALAAMETLDAERLYETVTSRHISMCGVLPAVIVMETLKNLKQLRRSERVAYATSGDVSGDRDRVVGYAGMLLGG